MVRVLAGAVLGVKVSLLRSSPAAPVSSKTLTPPRGSGDWLPCGSTAQIGPEGPHLPVEPRG